MERPDLRLVTVAVFIGFVAGCAPATTTARAPAVPAPLNQTVFLENFTWTELRDAISAGKTTIIVPVGGVEQSGPLIALGKHDARVKFLSGKIAERLGNALVAPVVAYVPEGGVDPPTEHMRFPGTITVPPDTFRQMLESAAMSFRHAGFRDIVLLGDHGGYQSDLRIVADDLDRLWAGTPARAHYIAAYYTVTQTSYVAALRSRGYSPAEIGSHAGLADTALTLAMAPTMVRADRLGQGAAPGVPEGVHGDPTRASAALGQIGVDMIINQTTSAIQAAARRP